MIEWREIKGFPKKEVSNNGLVRDARTLKEHKLSIKPAGYTFLMLKDTHGMKRYPNVHRLVALAFLGDPPTDSHQIAHNNGIPSDNRIENLRWATPKQNSDDRIGHGTMDYGSKNHAAKIAEEDVHEIDRLYAAGWKMGEIGNKFGLRRSEISRVLHKQRWGHIERKLPLRRTRAKKLTEEKVHQIDRLYASGMSHEKIGSIVGISQSQVSLVVRRKSWSHVEKKI